MTDQIRAKITEIKADAATKFGATLLEETVFDPPKIDVAPRTFVARLTFEATDPKGRIARIAVLVRDDGTYNMGRL